MRSESLSPSSANIQNEPSIACRKAELVAERSAPGRVSKVDDKLFALDGADDCQAPSSLQAL